MHRVITRGLARARPAKGKSGGKFSAPTQQGKVMVTSVLSEGVAVAQQLRKERADRKATARALRRFAVRLRMHDKGTALTAPVFEEDVSAAEAESVVTATTDSSLGYITREQQQYVKRQRSGVNEEHSTQIQRVLERLTASRTEWRDKWITGSGEAITEEEMMLRTARHVREGGKVYVGTDSGIREEKSWCVFCTAVCLHGADGQRGGQYLYRRTILPARSVSNLQARMTAEAQHSIELAQQLVETCHLEPSNLELHLDIGTSEKSKTRTFAQSLLGYAVGYGFKTKVKPDAWAAHNVADRHS